MIQKQVYSDPELRRKVKLNQPTVISVKMLDDHDNVIREFDSLTDVCRYFNKDQGNTSALHSVLDKFNKNGKRAKFWGHALILLNFTSLVRVRLFWSKLSSVWSPRFDQAPCSSCLSE